MAFKTSYSQNSTYVQCPRHWHNLYNEKLRSPKEGASLYFGSAMDAAVTLMLEDKQKGLPFISKNYLDKFESRWELAFNSGKPVNLFDNDNIVYSYNDFDEHVLTQADGVTLGDWAKDLGLTAMGSTPVSIYKEIAKIKKNPYKNTTPKQMQYFNRVSWLSLKRKGAVLLNAFETQFFPRIKKVIAIQQHAKLADPSTGDSIVGVIDMVLEIDGWDKPIIFDLKTAATPYIKEQIDMSEQLTSYAAMKAQEYGTDLVGYCVLIKNIAKDFINTCSNCGHLRTGRHQTCDNLVNGNRCGGKWDEQITCNPEVQVMVQRKTPEQIQDLLQDVSSIVLAMKNGIVYKNLSKCDNWYGSVCPYKKLCHSGDSTGLVKK